MRACVCVCPCPRLLITSGVMWRDIETSYDWLNKFYTCYKFSWVSIHGNLCSVICLRYNICSTWFLDIRISTCFEVVSTYSKTFGLRFNAKFYLCHILCSISDCRSFYEISMYGVSCIMFPYQITMVVNYDLPVDQKGR